MRCIGLCHPPAQHHHYRGGGGAKPSRGTDKGQCGQPLVSIGDVGDNQGRKKKEVMVFFFKNTRKLGSNSRGQEGDFQQQSRTLGEGSHTTQPAERLCLWACSQGAACCSGARRLRAGIKPSPRHLLTGASKMGIYLNSRLILVLLLLYTQTKETSELKSAHDCFFLPPAPGENEFFYQWYTESHIRTAKRI